ncbi:Viral A-type inclusion protein [Bacillus cereus Rock3-42]|nr:Viral A-type inclusion protein [Bacillus cereus Rock3-42]
MLVKDPRFVVGVLSLLGVIYTVRKTAENVNKTNNLKKEIDEQTNKLKKELADQTNEITKELGEKNLKALEQRRYIDAISSERVKWINTMRDRFSEYLKLTYIQMHDMNMRKKGDNDKVDEKQLIERLSEITYISNHITLLLNPTEPISEQLIALQSKVHSSLLIGPPSDFDYNKVEELGLDLAYFHQVVLKAEWKRVKEENKEGEEIDQERMKLIYETVAKKINNKTYNKYFDPSEN